MSTTANLGITHLQSNQGSAEITINDALNIVDALLPKVVVAYITDPPVSPNNGEVWAIQSPAAAGVWAGHDNELAVYINGWIFITPSNGWTVWDQTNTRVITFIAGVWDIPKGIAALNQTISPTPTQAEVQAISDKVDEMQVEFKHQGLIN